MATKTLLQLAPLGNEPPAANAAPIGWRNAHPYLRFAPQPGTQQVAVWSAIMPTAYAGGNLIVRVKWAAVPTTGTVAFDATFERVADGGQDIDADGWATAQTIAAATVDATSGNVKTSSVTATAGATGTDSIAAGDLFRLRVRRDLADTAAGDAQLLLVELCEA